MTENIVTELQKEAKQFIAHNKLVLNGVEIYPKEIEVYYYKEGEFEDKSVHRNELQKNNKNHFYVHRCKKSDSYKGGNRAGLDFVVSNDKNTYYSYLIRSAEINHRLVYGPNNVLNEIKRACGYDGNTELEKQNVNSVSSDVKHKDIIYTTRFGLGNSVDAYFRALPLRLVVLDNNFKCAQYKAKEQIVLDYLIQSKNTKEQAETFCKERLTYLPSKIKEYYGNKT